MIHLAQPITKVGSTTHGWFPQGIVNQYPARPVVVDGIDYRYAYQLRRFLTAARLSFTYSPGGGVTDTLDLAWCERSSGLFIPTSYPATDELRDEALICNEPGTDLSGYLWNNVYISEVGTQRWTITVSIGASCIAKDDDHFNLIQVFATYEEYYDDTWISFNSIESYPWDKTLTESGGTIMCNPSKYGPINLITDLPGKTLTGTLTLTLSEEPY